MKDISYVLMQKEQDLLRVQHEIEALRVAITLLSDENTGRGEPVPIPTRNGNRWPLEIH